MSFILKTTSEILSALGQRLRAQRLMQDMTQQNLAQMSGLSLGAVRGLERSGQSSLETLVRVSQALGVVGELEPLFVLKRHSIAEMEKIEVSNQRQRAPRRKAN